MYHADIIGGLVSRFCGVKKIFWNVRSSGISHTKNNLSTIFFYYLFLILSPLIPYKIIINSKRAISSHNYFEKNKFILIHNGFKKKKIHARFIKNRVSNTFRIGHYARFDPQKNHKAYS